MIGSLPLESCAPRSADVHRRAPGYLHDISPEMKKDSTGPGRAGTP